MATIVISHKVGNFDTWLKGHQDRLNIFSKMVSNFETFRDPNDPNSVAMTMEVNDMEKLNEVMNDPAVQPFKEKHTVIDPISVFVKVPV